MSGSFQDRRRALATVLEVAASVAFASLLVALLKPVAPVAGLDGIYLLAVLLIAIRRGQVAAVVTALLAALVFNFFFLEPIHRLTIAESKDVVALGVLLIAALAVGRLAATARRRASEAETRAQLAAAREREATIVADAASSLLGEQQLDRQLDDIARSVASTSGEHLRLGFSAAPAARAGESSISLPTRERLAWLYAPESAGWTRHDLERFAGSLAGLIDVAVEGARASARVAEVEAARRADTAKTAVLHAISHDLRSPLTAIRTAAGGLAVDGLAPGDSDELVRVIEEESARLSSLVDDLLDLSRIQADAVGPRADWCELADVVATAIAQVRGRQGEHPVEIDLPPGLPLIRADASQLERVFANLIDNAVKFSPPGAPVRVSGGVGGGKVTIRITDRGPGIPPSQRGSVFEPFFQGRRGAGGGSGLGLAICRGFVEANGGEIALQSDSGQGTAFAVYFPLVEQPVTVG